MKERKKENFLTNVGSRLCITKYLPCGRPIIRRIVSCKSLPSKLYLHTLHKSLHEKKPKKFEAGCNVVPLPEIFCLDEFSSPSHPLDSLCRGSHLEICKTERIHFLQPLIHHYAHPCSRKYILFNWYDTMASFFTPKLQ